MNVLLGALKNSATSVTTVVPTAVGSQKEKPTPCENAIPGNLLFHSLPYVHNGGVIAKRRKLRKVRSCASPAV